MKILFVEGNCPSIEEGDTKKLSPNISRVDIFIGDKFGVQNRESSIALCLLSPEERMQRFQVYLRNGATIEVAMVQIAHVFCTSLCMHTRTCLNSKNKSIIWQTFGFQRQTSRRLQNPIPLSTEIDMRVS